jgi:hypothetical protein
LEDPRVAGVVALNAVSLVWPPPLLSSGSRQYLRSRDTWRRFLHDPGLRREAANRARRSAQLAVSRVRRNGRLLASSHEVVEALHAAGVPVALGASPGEAILEDLALLSGSAAGLVRRFEGPAGAHTLSTASLRAQADQLLDEAAEQAITAARGDQAAQVAP